MADVLEKFEPYFEAINLSNTIQTEIRQVYKICTKICPEEIEEIFVEDTMRSDGERSHTAVNYFSPSYIMCKTFASDDEIVIEVLKQRIISCRIRVKDFNMSKATQDSRIHIEMVLLHSTKWVFQAASNNCDHFLKVLDKYIKPNLLK